MKQFSAAQKFLYNPRFYHGRVLSIKRPAAVLLALMLFLPLGCGLFSAKGYLPSAQKQFAQFPAAPAAGSAEDKADINILLEWQAKRTPAECARARAESHGSFEIFFGSISPFGRPVPPEVMKFFDRVHADLDDAVGAVKERNKRPRPFLRNMGIEPSLDRIGGYSYPSGHSANAHLFALILSDLVPERRAEFMARADEAALDRVIGGVHHPTDIEAGKKIADQLYGELQKNPAFLKDRESLRKYLR